MQTDLLTSTEFYILDTSFRRIHALTQYESLMWVDKYDEPGSIEIYAPPIKEILDAAKVGNYIYSNKSEHLMIIEKLVTTFTSNNGERLIISGRSLESILDRRILFMDLYMRNKRYPGDEEGSDNLEDAVRQILDVTFINPENEDRKVSNFIFEYSNAPVPLTDRNNMPIFDSNGDYILCDRIGINTIHDIVLEDMQFNKGDNVLDIVMTIVRSKKLGFKITVNNYNQFVFKIINGDDHTSDQTINPLVEFSPIFNNLKDSKFTVDAGENFKNYIYTEGESYKKSAPKIVETGEAVGIDRREYYVTSSSTHETEASNVYHTGIVKEKKKLTEEEYEDVLKKEGENSFKSFAAKTTMESEVEPNLQFAYNKDYSIGDIVQIKDSAGNISKAKVVEFIISHSTSGYEEYPTFEDINEETESPSQGISSGGEYSDEGSMTNDEIIQAAMEAMMPVGYIYQTTDPTDPNTIFGFGTWESLSDYSLLDKNIYIWERTA